MTIEKNKNLESAHRRAAVKTIVGGVSALAAYQALPFKWGTPIVEQIFLPAHAATSGVSLHDPCDIVLISGYQDSNTVVIEVNGYVIPPTKGLLSTIVATGNPDSSATTTVQSTTNTDGTFQGTLSLTTATGLGSITVVTTVTGASGSAECTINIPKRALDDVEPEEKGEEDVGEVEYEEEGEDVGEVEYEEEGEIH